MSRPDTGRRIEQRRAEIYDAGLPIAPFSSRLIHANYADRGIAIATGVSGSEDVVGNRDFVQADTTKQPAYGLFTTKPALVFDGVNDFMASPAVDLTPYSSITFCCSFVFNGGTTKMVYETGPANTAGGFRILEVNGTTCTLFFTTTVGFQSKVLTLVAGTTYRLIFVLNASAAAVTFPLTYVNGVVAGAPAGTSDRGLASLVHYLGMREGTSLPWAGKWGDCFIYNGALSVAEIGTVDAFLASRCT